MSNRNTLEQKAARRAERKVNKLAYNLVSPKLKEQESLSQFMRRIRHQMKKFGLAPKFVTKEQLEQVATAEEK